jgi:hypothetical protein
MKRPLSPGRLLIAVAVCWLGCVWPTSGLAQAATPAYVSRAKEITAGFKGTPGVVLHVGDSITHANPYGQWARFGEGQTEDDKAVLKWMHTGKGNELDGWHLAAVDRPGGHSDTACGGITAQQMLAGSRGDFPSLKTMLDKYKPQIVVLMLGTNDASGGRKLEDYLSDMSKCVDTVEAANAICILSTIPPHIGRTELAASYNEGLRKLAGQRKIPLIDYEKEILRLQPDNWNGTLLNKNDVHPTAHTGDVKASSAPTEENLKLSGYLLRGWLSVQKIKEVKKSVLDKP